MITVMRIETTVVKEALAGKIISLNLKEKLHKQS